MEILEWTFRSFMTVTRWLFELTFLVGILLHLAAFLEWLGQKLKLTSTTNHRRNP